MTFQGDPHRTLGIPPGASLNEIRSAYRRLVKKYHPDTAGERALPRFLAIRAAYEQLVDGEGRLRASRPAGPTGQAGQAARGSRPAGGGGAKASRDAWRARRAAGAGGVRTGTTSGGAGQAKATPGGGSGKPGQANTGSATAGRSSTRRPAGDESRARRGSRKATPGSTTYDEAAETPLDPTWDGGAWYGPTSGTYWTLNPREYADPRKHGPEYEARARRAAQAEGAGASPAAATDVVPDPDPAGEAGSQGGP